MATVGFLMRGGRHQRQVFLFVAALLLPAAVLIGLSVRIIGQEIELAGKRADDERRDAIQQLRREMASHLEAIKLQEINGLIRSPELKWIEGPENPAVVFIAKQEAERLVLPWDVLTRSPQSISAEFARHRRAGEREEFIKKDFRNAADAYRQAIASARNPSESAEARLLLACVLAKAGNGEAAARNYHTLLNEPGDERDEQGVAFRLYAADRLLEAKREQEAVLSFLIEKVKAKRRVTLPEIYMIRSMLESIPGDEARQAREMISGRIDEMEEAAALARDLPRVRAQIESSTSSGTVWIPFGKEPWLITLTPPAPPVPALVLAVSSVKTTPPGVKLGARGLEGDALGEGFPGVRVDWPANRFALGARRGVPFALYVAGLALVLGVTVMGGYLLLRDVNRDIRLAEVRSQFVASVSHELKTPLTAIRMFAETLSLGRSKDERTRAEYLDTIVNESERLARLVDNVLDFSKIEQGKKIYRFRPTSLAGVADSAVRAIQYPLLQQGFTLRLSIEDNLPSLRADADALEQAILNLLTNAMKYSGDSREIDLRLRALLRHEEDHHLSQGLLNEDIRMAQRVQHELFPRFLPAIAGIDYAGVCQPARSVSGDYYDFFQLGSGRLGLLLADVSGKGISAALLGASLHSSVRAHAPAAGDRCGELITRINRILFETTTPERYATVFYAVYEPSTKMLTYANAGHPSPMVVRRGTCVRLPSTSPPAGLLPVLPGVQHSLQLASGDWVLIFSDGVPEAASESGACFEDEMLLDALERSCAGTAAEVCESIVNEVRYHARGQRQADDLTLIAAKIL